MTTNVRSAYGRAVLGIAIAAVAVGVGIEFGEVGRRGRRVRKVFWGAVVKIWSWSMNTCTCVLGRLKIKPGMVYFGRRFPAREGKLRHGPLCEQDEGGSLEILEEAGDPGARQGR